MKFNKFLIAGAAVAILSFGAHAQEAPTNTQQEMNPTVAKTLNTFGGFLGAIVQSAKTVVDTTANGVKTMANSEGGQNIKNGVIKGATFVSNTASDVAHSEIGQTVSDNAVKGAKFVANTATDGAKSIANSEGGQNIKNGALKGAKFVSNTASDVAHSEVGKTVTDGTVKGAKFVAHTATDGAKSVSKGFKESNENVEHNNSNINEPSVEAASVTSVSQPASTPSISEGFEAAKGKIGGMINFLRDKAVSRDTTPDNETPKMK